MSERTRNLPRRTCLPCRARARRCSARRPASAPTWCSSTSRTRVAPLEKEAARDKVVRAINEHDWGDTVAVRARERVGHRVDVPRRHPRRRERGRAPRRDHAAEGAVGEPRWSRSTSCSRRSRRPPGARAAVGIEAQIETARGPHQRRGDLRGVRPRSRRSSSARPTSPRPPRCRCSPAACRSPSTRATTSTTCSRRSSWPGAPTACR